MTRTKPGPAPTTLRGRATRRSITIHLSPVEYAAVESLGKPGAVVMGLVMQAIEVARMEPADRPEDYTPSGAPIGSGYGGAPCAADPPPYRWDHENRAFWICNGCDGAFFVGHEGVQRAYTMHRCKTIGEQDEVKP